MDELTHLDLNAADSHGDNRNWRVDKEQILSIFDILHTTDKAEDIIVQLYSGRTVIFPGKFNAVDLVQLGFRIMPAKSARLKTDSDEASVFQS